MIELTPVQKTILSKMEFGKLYYFRTLRCSTSTLEALYRKGYLEKEFTVGSMLGGWGENTGWMYSLKQREQDGSV
jgi:hypothetical protein